MSRSVLLTSAQKHWQLTIASTIWICQIVFSTTLLCRWLTGAFTLQQPLWWGAFVTLSLAVISIAARGLAHQSDQSCCCSFPQSVGTFFADLLTVIPPVVCGITLLSLNSATSISFLIVLTLLLCVAVFFIAESSHADVPYFLNIVLWGESALKPQEQLEESTPTEEINLSLEQRLLQQAESLDTNIISDIHPESTSQTITHHTNAKGCEVISGTIQVTLVAKAKQATAHIPFTPPFATKPEVTCKIENDITGKVLPTAIYTYGTRLEIRLIEPAEEEIKVDVTFSAVGK